MNDPDPQYEPHPDQHHMKEEEEEVVLEEELLDEEVEEDLELMDDYPDSRHDFTILIMYHVHVAGRMSDEMERF